MIDEEYESVLEYLFSQLPMFQNIGRAAYKKDLGNTIELLKYFGNPEKGKTHIHIAGTNGKGSVSSMLAAIFTAHGYRTGLYTSPHLLDFKERIRINGEKISKQFIIDFTQQVKEKVKLIQPSFFEITVAMAFLYFQQQNTDINIVETGLGGRLDSTNVIQPILSIITNIGWDHMDMLGDTLDKIATEKAGIIKSNIPVLVGEKIASTQFVFEEKCKLLNAPLFWASAAPQSWHEAAELKGKYQTSNINTVYTAVQLLSQQQYQFEEKKILEALQNIKRLTGLQGRWDIESERPFVVADTGHNKNGLEMTIQQFLEQKHLDKKYFLLGFVKEKDIRSILELFPKNAIYFFIKPQVQRGLDVELLSTIAAEMGIENEACSSMEEALIKIKNNLTERDGLYIGGSTFVVADYLSYKQNNSTFNWTVINE